MAIAESKGPSNISAVLLKDFGTTTGEGFGFEVFLEESPEADVKINAICASLLNLPRTVVLKQLFTFLKSVNRLKKGSVFADSRYARLKNEVFDRLIDQLMSEKDFRAAAKLYYQFQFLSHTAHGSVCQCIRSCSALRDFSFWKAWLLTLTGDLGSDSPGEDISAGLEVWIANFGPIIAYLNSKEKLSELYNCVSARTALPALDHLIALASEKKGASRLVLWRTEDLEPATEANSFETTKIALKP